jgi:hypothetical protein
MSRPRLPAQVAKTIGAEGKNPQRFRDRSAPKVAKLGAPPRSFTEDQRAAWNAFADEMPWLAKSDRGIVEVASRLRAAMESDPLFPMPGYAQLRLCISAMGGTPADRTKVVIPDGDKEADPADEFLN